MTRPALAALAIALSAVGLAPAQVPTPAPVLPAVPGIPFDPPKPLGGPIVGPDGKVLSALDRTGPWGGGVEFGLNGSQGNVDILKVRAGVDLKYDDPSNVFVLSGLYVFSEQGGSVLEQKGLLTTRDEIPFDAAWAWFAQGQLEYDQFRAIDFRLAAHNGLAFKAYDDGVVKVKVRGGIGGSREFGGAPGTDWIPEAQAGADYEYLLSNRTRFCLTGDYYPDLRDTSHYRIRARATLDVLIDPELNLVLRLGVQDRYDSRPLGAKNNDLDYFLSILFRF